MRTPLLALLALTFLSPLVAEKKPDIFVVSRGGETPFNAKQEAAFRDGLAAELAAHGFSATLRDDRIANEDDAGDVAATLNQARQTGSDYALVATLGSLESEIRQFSGYDVETTNIVYKLGFSYRLLRADDGNALVGSSGTVSRTFRESEGTSTASSDAPAPLLRLAAKVIADEVAARVAPEDLAVSDAEDSTATVAIEPVGMGMTLPEVIRNEDGELYVTGERTDVVLNAVTVLVDGIAVGSAPGEIETEPGLHEVTLQREGFKEWTRTVNVREGLELTIRLTPTDKEIKRFRDEAAFVESLRTQRALTDAEVERIEGIAEMLRQSGYRWDIRVDTDEAIRIEQNNRTIMGDNPDAP